MTDFTDEAEIRKMGAALKLPQSEIERLVKIARVNKELEKKHGKPKPKPFPRTLTLFDPARKPVKFVEPKDVEWLAAKVWCDQCQRQVLRKEARECEKPYCKAKPLVIEQENEK